MNRLILDPNAVAYSATPANRLLDELARWTSYVLAALLLAGVSVLWWRHFAMALRQPLTWPGLLLAGGAAAGTGALARTLFRWAAPSGDSRQVNAFFECIVSLCLLAWGTAVSLGGGRAGGLILFWGILVGEEIWAWWRALGLDQRFLASRTAQDDSGIIPGTSEDRDAPDDSVDRLPQAPRILAKSEILQELVRSQEAGGAECLSGWIRVPLAVGQRSAAVHLAFCPPFSRTPRVTVVQQDGPPARIKPVQVLPFGVRLDLKLIQASSASGSVLMEIAVRAGGEENGA